MGESHDGSESFYSIMLMFLAKASHMNNLMSMDERHTKEGLAGMGLAERVVSNFNK